MKHKILFVCLGNICRSPAAEGIFRDYVEKIGRAEDFEIDSAGLINNHEGNLPDSRMRAHAIRRGYKLTSLSRPVQYDDFFDFDLIIGMDASNIQRLKERAPTIEAAEKISLISDFLNPPKVWDHIPDPYYGGAEGFEQVLDMLEEVCPLIVDFVDL